MVTLADSGPGRRLAAARRRRRLSQQQLADAAGTSVDTVRKLEQRQRHSARLDTLAKLARALDIPVADLVDPDDGQRSRDEPCDVASLRRAVLGMAPEVDPPQSVADLQRTLPGLWRVYWAGGYSALANDLPDRLTAVKAAARSSQGAARTAAHATLAELLQVTASLLAHLGHEDLAHLALHGASHAAEAAGDELLHAGQQATRAWILSRQGLWTEAEHLAATTASQIEPSLSRASLDQVAVWGELLRQTAVALSRSARHTEAADALTLMRAAAARIDGDNRSRYAGITFGPTVVGMRAVDAAISAGNYRQALDLSLRVEHPDRIPPAMHCRYLLAVAWAQVADWRSGEALTTVLRAERLTPEALTHHGIAKAIVAELLPRRRAQRLPGLTTLAERIGVTG